MLMDVAFFQYIQNKGGILGLKTFSVEEQALGNLNYRNQSLLVGLPDIMLISK